MESPANHQPDRPLGALPPSLVSRAPRRTSWPVMCPPSARTSPVAVRPAMNTPPSTRAPSTVIAFGIRVEGESFDLADLSLPWGQDAVIAMVSDYHADAKHGGRPGRRSEQASEQARTPHEHARRRRLTLALTVAGLLILFAAPAGAADPVRAAGSEAAGAQRGNFASLVEIRGGRKIYLECRGRGGPTVVLVSGHGNAADIWGEKARVQFQEGLPDLYPGLDLPVRGPAVMRGVARLTRVCAYDRPNNRLLDDRPSRSDPVAQPVTAGSSVADLHALLRAARVPGPYLLVGHSFGGLIVRLYASRYPRQVAGLVSVEASTEFVRDQLTPQQNARVKQLGFDADSVPGIDPPLEIADFYTSFDQMIRAKAARPLRPTLPMVVLTRGLPSLPLPPDLALPPGFPDVDTLDRTW